VDEDTVVVVLLHQCKDFFIIPQVVFRLSTSGLEILCPEFFVFTWCTDTDILKSDIGTQAAWRNYAVNEEAINKIEIKEDETHHPYPGRR
jgi:hypothetical protein